MERGSLLKWGLIALAVMLFWQFGKPLLFGAGPTEQPLGIADNTAPSVRAPEQICTIQGPRFTTSLTTRSASLDHLLITDPKYFRNMRPEELASLPKWKQYFGAPPRSNEPEDLKTNAFETRNPMRTDLRVPGLDDKEQQVAFDNFDWKLEERDDKRCVFSFENDDAKLVKTIATNDKPFELAVSLTIENKASSAKKHRLTFEETSWKAKKQLEGRSSTETSEVIAVGTKAERFGPSDFEPKDFEKKEFTPEKWRRTPGDAKLIGVGSVYFAKAAIPIAQPAPPVGETQIEEYWDKAKYGKDKQRDEHYGYMYRARLDYPEKTLGPGEKATYEILTFNGPKERDVLAAAGHGFGEVVDLAPKGFSLHLDSITPVTKGIVWYLEFLHNKVGNWGLALVILTFTVRALVLPLSLSQIKNSAAMRKLKPEMDEINKRYKDDAAQRGLATQELWRKHGIGNPVLGCLPMLLQLPIWWALWAAIQALVELYHQPFLWFPDLSARDPYFIIPIVLGASSFLQQRLMPTQGDASQQKMMMYMMPGVFMVMMLFLPSGLGLYMLTSSIFGIAQQLLVERWLRARNAAKGGPGQGAGEIIVREKASGDGNKSAPRLGKGKARVGG